MGWAAALAIARCVVRCERRQEGFFDHHETEDDHHSVHDDHDIDHRAHHPGLLPTTVAPADGSAPRKAANIVAKDFPAGWTAAEHTIGESTTFAKCASDIDLEHETTAEASLG